MAKRTTDPSKRSAEGKGAYKSKISYTDKRNAESYDRLTVRVPKGYRDKLLKVMNDRVAEVETLQAIPDRTTEQENRLNRLRSLYTVSDRGMPSINNLIVNLLKNETGIEI